MDNLRIKELYIQMTYVHTFCKIIDNLVFKFLERDVLKNDNSIFWDWINVN